MVNLLVFLMLVMQAPVGQDYIIKQGDSITITVWERPSLSGTIKVDPNGYINLPMPIGSILIAGMTSAKVTQALTDKIKEYVLNPTVFVSILPSEGFTVHVLGEIRMPDFLRITEGTTLQEAISRSGGFTEFSDKKNIKIIREEKDSETKKPIEMVIDFERFTEYSDFSANPVLESGDTIFIPRMQKAERTEKLTKRSISVFGAVFKPGIIDTEESLPLMNVIAMAGGATKSAITKEISILSIVDDKFTRKYVDFESFISGDDPKANPEIFLGEMVFVPEKSEEEAKSDKAVILGQVKTPGIYPITKESRLFDTLYAAGGFAEDANIDEVTITHKSTEGLIKDKISVKEFLKTGDLKFNPIIEKDDTIYVPLSQNAKEIPYIHDIFIPSIRISVIGEVGKPDTFHVSKDTNLLEVLKIAGGPSGQSDLKKVTIIREITDSNSGKRSQTVDIQKVLSNGEFHLLPKLNDGDTIFVPRRIERTLWSNIIKTASDISTLMFLFYIIIGQRY
jgi:protein involved in polysaccharide export with SLBB domain